MRFILVGDEGHNVLKSSCIFSRCFFFFLNHLALQNFEVQVHLAKLAFCVSLVPAVDYQVIHSEPAACPDYEAELGHN